MSLATGEVEVCLVLPILERGDEGSEVQRLKVMLNAVGGGLPLDESNPVFGPKTEQRIRQFQWVLGLEVNGRVEKETWQKLLWHWATFTSEPG